MRLEYCILWFENDEEFVELERGDIEDYLRDLWFAPRVIQRRDDKNLKRVLKDNDVNLILVDYDLKEAGMGDRLIDAIRKADVYQEIVFYSQIRSFRSKIKPQLQGVYYATGGNLLEKTKTVIDLTIKKNQDISNVRGLFIAEAIDMAGQMEEILAKILKISGRRRRRFFTGYMLRSDNMADATKFKIIKHFLKEQEEKLKAIIQKLPAGSQKSNLQQVASSINTITNKLGKFQTQVIEVRDSLAHVKPSPKKKNTLLCKDREELFNEEKCKETRKSFLEHSENLRQLMILLDDKKNSKWLECR